MECAPPACYTSCAIFAPRADGKCLRLSRGMTRNRDYTGLFSFGAQCSFRKWAKLETNFVGAGFSPAALRRLDRWHAILSRAVYVLSSALLPLSPRRRLCGAFIHLRRELLNRLQCSGAADYDAFVIECHSMESQPFTLCLQCDTGKVLLRESFQVIPGYNRFLLTFDQFQLGPAQRGARIFIWPDNDREVSVVFTWLDFVKFAPGEALADNRSTEMTAGHAEKVKCVAWDLDNTLWKGILVEKGIQGVELCDAAVAVIKQLDERGIINTIVSKNSYDEAWQALTRFGLCDYFVYPAINWGAKSRNLEEIAARINIGIDSFAFIDDSPFEREAVRVNLPMVRVFDETQIGGLLARGEFQVPVTEMSRQRRLSYLAEMKREAVQSAFGDDDLAFLHSCAMEAEIFIPHTAAEQERCFELLLRSNQLNLSGRRYEAAEYEALLADPDWGTFGFRCRDKFGDYGIVGFFSVAHDPAPRIVDLVISCRVAKKRVEHAVIAWLAGKEAARGHATLQATLIKSKKNGPLADVFSELPFTVSGEDEARIEYVMALPLHSEPAAVVTLRDATGDRRS